MTACPVTVYRDAPDHRNMPRPCGLPVDRYGLCAKHAADKERLSVRRDASDQLAEHTDAMAAEHEPRDDYVNISGLLIDADRVPDRGDA